MGELIIPRWDTSKDQEISISVDIGVVPAGYPGAGQFIITAQLWPIAKRGDAEKLEAAVREAISARLGIKLVRQGVA